MNVGTTEDAGGARSDTIMLVNIPANRKRVVAVSFPRDLAITPIQCEAPNPDTSEYGPIYDSDTKKWGPKNVYTETKLNSTFSSAGGRLPRTPEDGSLRFSSRTPTPGAVTMSIGPMTGYAATGTPHATLYEDEPERIGSAWEDKHVGRSVAVREGFASSVTEEDRVWVIALKSGAGRAVPNDNFGAGRADFRNSSMPFSSDTRPT